MNPFRRFLEAILGRPRACPHCGAREAGFRDRADELDEAIAPGMMIVCARCAGLIQVGPRLIFLEPTEGDLERLRRSPQAALVRREQNLVRRARARLASRRGHLEGHEHWDCPRCKTANYGDACTRCGGPAPWRRP